MAHEPLRDVMPFFWKKVLRAVESRSVGTLSFYLKRFPKTNITQRSSLVKTLLNAAIKHHRPEVAQFLVRKFHADIPSLRGSPDRVLERVMCEAVKWSNGSDLVKELVKLGVDVNVVSRSGTLLMVACYHRRFCMVKLLLSLGADVNQQDGNDETPLMAAASLPENLAVETVRCLLEHGADVNLQSSCGETALHVAAERSSEVVTVLLSRHPQCLRDDSGFTPLFVAVYKGRDEIFDVFFSSNFVSREDKVDALEFKAATQAPGDMNGVYHFLHQAMQLRYEDSGNVLTKPISGLGELFGNIGESQNLKELEARRDNEGLLLVECLAVLDRLLERGEMFRKNRFHGIWTALFDEGYHDAVMTLVERDIEGLSIEHATYTFLSMPYMWYTDAESLGHSATSAVEKGLQCGIKILQQCANNSDQFQPHRFSLLEYCLKLLNLHVQLDRTNAHQSASILAKAFIDSFPLPNHRFFSALHATTFLKIFDNDALDLSVYKSLVGFLVVCGARINDKDAEGRTVLAYVVHDMAAGDDRREIFEFLLLKGADPAYLSTDAGLPYKYAQDQEAIQLLQPHYPLSLQHLAAFVLVGENVKFQEGAPSKVEEFIKSHK